MVHDEDVIHFPPELTDPDILANMVNFSPNSKAKVVSKEDSNGNICLEPPVEEFRLTQLEVKITMNMLKMQDLSSGESRQQSSRCEPKLRQ